ncbi:hypothetical protein FRC0306_01724 [Corynebacterium diphtheriae]|nr:hypothetical protein FRC0306_01724 [Corynebacterium diphtheriae]
MNTTGETTQPFYSHCDMNDPLCRAERLRIQFDYYRWHSLQPGVARKSWTRSGAT